MQVLTAVRMERGLSYNSTSVKEHLTNYKGPSALKANFCKVTLGGYERNT